MAASGRTARRRRRSSPQLLADGLEAGAQVAVLLGEEGVSDRLAMRGHGADQPRC